MELTNQFMTTEIHKTVAVVVQLSENLLGHGHTVWMVSFCCSPVLAWFMKSTKKKCWKCTC
jgi:hypothetical protein